MARNIFDMTRHSFENVSVLIVDPDKIFRERMKQDLADIGFKVIHATGSMDDIKKYMTKCAIDLLICDMDADETNAVNIVRNVRLGRYSNNIFPVVISLLSHPNKQTVHHVIDSGTDAILVKPVQFASLEQRILELTSRRERFVVTCDYIGPDRRKAAREGSMLIPKTEVPNPLRNKVTGYLNKIAYENYVARVSDIINELRIQRQSYQMGYLMDKIQPNENEAPRESGMPQEWPCLVFTARDIAHRINGSRFSSVKGMASTLLNFVDDMEASGGLVENDFRLLSHLTRGISRGCHVE